MNDPFRLYVMLNHHRGNGRFFWCSYAMPILPIAQEQPRRRSPPQQTCALPGNEFVSDGPGGQGDSDFPLRPPGSPHNPLKRPRARPLSNLPLWVRTSTYFMIKSQAPTRSQKRQAEQGAPRRRSERTGLVRERLSRRGNTAMRRLCCRRRRFCDESGRKMTAKGSLYDLRGLLRLQFRHQ